MGNKHLTTESVLSNGLSVQSGWTGGGALSEVVEGEIALGGGAAIDAVPRLRVRAFGSIRVEGSGVTLTARDFEGAATISVATQPGRCTSRCGATVS